MSGWETMEDSDLDSMWSESKTTILKYIAYTAIELTLHLFNSILAYHSIWFKLHGCGCYVMLCYVHMAIQDLVIFPHLTWSSCIMWWDLLPRLPFCSYFILLQLTHLWSKLFEILDCQAHMQIAPIHGLKSVKLNLSKYAIENVELYY